MRLRLRIPILTLVRTLVRTVVRTLICTLIHPWLHSVSHAIASSRMRSLAEGRCHHQRVHGCVLLGKEGIESIHVPAKILRSLSRARHKGGVNSATAQVRAHTHPAQRRVFESRLCLP
jgi:hypothetical protein